MGVDVLEFEFLGRVNSPAELKKLNFDELGKLCDEIRSYLIDVVSKNGGHLASNLGAVELTVAIHRVFNSPEDSIIFDVGHQCYTHKLLTGRYAEFTTLRKEGGISGFMRPDESIHDPFVTGHASNSIAAAYGISKAKTMLGKKGSAVAVIGDGAMTGGLALEAMNNIGCDRAGFTLVINDNKMSISNNVGSMSRHLRKIRMAPGYYRFKSGTESFLHKIPLLGKPVFKLLSSVKRSFVRLVYRDNLFETLGFKFIGPVDGHDLKQLERAFNIAHGQSKPCVVHVVTVKGKGYGFAEANPGDYHGVSAFDTHDGLSMNDSNNFSTVSGAVLEKLAKEDERVCAITAAMTTGTGLDTFSKKFPDRFFDVGIAEGYAVTFAAGLASAGMRPFFAVYSSFLQRSYDQIIHDTAIAGLPLCLLVDRAGIVGEDGETHQGVFDVAFLSTVPGISIFSPSSYSELEGCIRRSLNTSTPLAIRYPRGKERCDIADTSDDFSVFSKGGKTAIVTYGNLVANALTASEKLLNKGKEVDVVKLNKIFPVSDELLEKVSDYDRVIFFEEGIRRGGIAEHIASKAALKFFKIVAIEGEFIPAMTIDAAYEKFGFDVESMIKTVEEN